MSNATLQARRVVKHYHGKSRPAVDGISFAIEKGESVGLLGPNGAGKTTLVKMICGVTTPTSGEILLFGRDTPGLSLKMKRDLAVVHQSAPMDNMLPAIDNIRIAAAYRGLRWRTVRDKVDEMIAEFGITDCMSQLTFTLSGGQRRRLQVVRALLEVPRLLLLDEPSAGLDVSGRRQMWDLLSKLCTEHGTTVLWTSHYVEELERNCGRVMIMNRGALLRFDTPTRLVDEFGRRSVVLTLPDPSDRERLVSLIGLTGGNGVTARHTSTGFDLSGSGTDAVLPQVIALVRDASSRGGGIEFRVPSLEDAFIQLVEGDKQ